MIPDRALMGLPKGTEGHNREIALGKDRGGVGVMVMGFRREAATGTLQPMSASNLAFLSLAVLSISFPALMVGLSWVFLLFASTTFSAWGIRRPYWLGNLAIPWNEIIKVTPDPIGLRFHTKGKTLFFPFRVMDSVPPELLSLLSEHVPEDALVGLSP